MDVNGRDGQLGTMVLSICLSIIVYMPIIVHLIWIEFYLKFRQKFLFYEIKRITMDKLIPKHSGYRALKTFQLARLIFDVTLRLRAFDFSRLSASRSTACRSVRSISARRRVHRTSLSVQGQLTKVVSGDGHYGQYRRYGQ